MTALSTNDLFVLVVFGIVYLGMILGGLPRLHLDRTGVALRKRRRRQARHRDRLAASPAHRPAGDGRHAGHRGDLAGLAGLAAQHLTPGSKR